MARAMSTFAIKLWGFEGERGLQALQKIRIVRPTYKVSVLCIVYTHSGRHSTGLQAVVKAYPSDCDGFLASSNMTDPTLGAVNIMHKGKEAYKNMWQKVRSTWAYVHENYLEKYDWFFISGDDTFVIAENLRHAAAQYPVDKTPIYLGSPAVYPPHPHWLCCSGGAGYTLNRAALRILYSKLTWTGCHPHDITSEEDRLIGTNCFRNIITCTASVDEIGEDRFHSLNTDFHAKWTLGVPAPWQPVTMRKYHHVTVKTEMESVSETRVTFHLNEAKNDGSYLTRSQSTSAVEGMRRYHAIVHGLCK